MVSNREPLAKSLLVELLINKDMKARICRQAKLFVVCGQRPKDLVITWVVLVLGVNLLLGCTSGLNLAADLEPVLALFLNGPLPGSFSLFSSFHLQLTVGR